MRHTGLRAAQARHFRVGRVHHMRVPHVRPDPAQLFGQLHRRAPKGLQAVGVLVLRFGQVRMRVHAIAARHRHTFAHQVGRNREGRAGREHHAQHTEALGVVVFLNQAARVAQNRRLVLDHAVGWQATLAFTHRHRAARGVEAKAQRLRRRDLVVEARTIRPDVGMIAGGGAARKHQLGNRNLRADMNCLGRHAGPDRVERAQPCEQVGVLRGGDVARQCLVEVVVRVHQARQHHHVARVDHGVRAGGQARARADLADLVAVDKHAAVGVARVGIVHGRQQRGVFQQQRPHRNSPSILNRGSFSHRAHREHREQE